MNDFLKGRRQCSLSAEAAHTGHRPEHPVLGSVAPDARASSKLLPFLVLSRRPSPRLAPLRRLADSARSALSLAVWESGGIKGGQDTLPHRRLWFNLFLRAYQRCLTALRHVLLERVWEDESRVRGKTDQRSQPGFGRRRRDRPADGLLLRSLHTASRSLLLAQPRAIVLPGVGPTPAHRLAHPRAKSLAAPLQAVTRWGTSGAGHAKTRDWRA